MVCYASQRNLKNDMLGIETTHKIVGYLWNNIYGSNIYSSIMIVIIYQKNKRNKNQEK